MKTMKPKRVFWLIIFLAFACLIIDLPKKFQLRFNLGKFKVNKTISSPEINISWKNFKFRRDLKIKQGLDLQGGTHLVLEANMDKIKEEEYKKALSGAKNVVSRRINLYGIAEPVVQTVETEGKYRLFVELPGVKNINQAIDLIGKTAQLDFRELPKGKESSSSAEIFNYQSTGLTGAQLKKAEVQFSQQTGEPIVSLHFDDKGAQLFSKITARNTGKRVAIFLDGVPLTVPTVHEAITSRDAVISGSFDLAAAKKLTIQLNAGALPVPLKVIEQQTIGASLGKESVQKSIIAGFIGLLMVALFMILAYGFRGFLADLALIIYGLITLALYKLIPITLTLPGIAGFILSIGMAVDSNILIFERMKEERWLGKPLPIAMELGFGRAWDSIKDANSCTLITAFVLFNPFNWGFLNNSGMVRGFALTLALGIAISLFTGIVVTRNFIRVFYRPKNWKEK